MGRKLFQSGNSTVVSIPPQVLQAVGLETGNEVIVTADPDRRHIVIRPAEPAPPGIDEAFLDQVDQFIERYRPALEKLAQE
jgi:putative addiction module antidote